MKYNDIIGVNENFQYSVNLQFDINNISKLKEYIPTKDGCELLKKYITSILKGKNRATTLIGPYGKGKSHLLLVLITLLDDYDTNDEEFINEFILKIKNIDEELFNMLFKMRKDKNKLMPIIINSNYGDLNQAFLLALSEALERENLKDVIVNTYFDVAIKVIEKWELSYKDAIYDFKRCLEEYNCTLKELKNGLKNYSEKHYEVFKNVYSCILHGQEFNPLVNSDIIKTYKDMTHEIENYGYNGIFIVFDEFSKFLEYTDNSHMMKDLKLLQDFAELADRTGINEQIHLSCITHKAMNQYAKNIDEEKINAFKTVEGRFKELFFNRSLEQNYEIVSYALKKKKGFKETYNSYFKNNIEFYELMKEIPIFKDLNKEVGTDILFKGCFPLNPITVYSLICLSEKVAQNERTLFTFLTDDDANSLKSFILNNNDGLFNINKIYDYFYPILKKEIDENIKKMWLKVENALTKTTDIMEKNLIKSLGIIYMINENEILIPNDITLRLSNLLTEEKYNLCINSLIEKSIFKRKKITNELEFTTIYNRELSKEVKRISDSEYNEINLKNTLNEIVDKSYAIPRRYNEKYKMTRFFLNVFMSEKELMSLNNFDILFESNYCDGIIIKLIRESRNIQEVRNHFIEINSNKVILEIPKVIFPKNVISLLKDYKSINKMFLDKELSGEIKEELNLMLNETVGNINEQTSIYFSEDNIQEYIYLNKITKKITNLSSYLSDICSSVYYKTPIINNELINKKNLSAPIKKARNIVIDSILLNNEGLIKSKTSAEATIYKATVEKKNTNSVKNIIEIITNFISNSENNKLSFDRLYKVLEREPYAIRKGIIPILIAMSIYNYSDIIVIYFMNKEIELDSENLIKINENPEKYFIYTEKGTKDKFNYLANLLELFEVENDNTQRINLKKLVDSMRRWVLSLPRILREFTNDNKEYYLKEEYITVKNELLKPDINNNEFIYNKLQDIFNCKDYEEIFKEILLMKKEFDNFLSNYLNKLINLTKEIFNSKYKGSLNTLLKEWLEVNKLKDSKKIFNLETKQLIEYIDEFSTHNEEDIIEKISKIVTGYYVEDWQSNDYENYKNNLNKSIEEINSQDLIKKEESNIVYLKVGDNVFEKYINSSDEITAIGRTMKSNIEELISEYGDSLNEEEKINVLLNIIKKYM